MRRYSLSANDVAIQVALSAVVHAYAGDVWTVASFSQRCGVVVPIALIGLSWWRQMKEATST